MKTEKLFNNFYKKSRREIAELVKKFVQEEFFVIFPELKDIVSIIIIGSVAHNHYDKRSDVDLAVIFHDEGECNKKKSLILGRFKGEHRESKIMPLQLHRGDVFSLQKLVTELELWENDQLLCEINEAIIIYDPANKIQVLKEKYAWYPDDIYKEKISRLFAESSYMIFDNYESAYKRKNLYYAEILKLEILKLFMLCVLLANKKYPYFEKHLMNDLRSLGLNAGGIVEQIEDLIKKKNMKLIYNGLVDFRNKIEGMLLAKNLIVKESVDYWVSFKVVHKVEI